MRALGVIVVAALTAGHVAAQTPATEWPAPTIATSAIATVSVPADLATISVTFTAVGRTPSQAGREAARKGNAIRDALIAIGIPRDSIPTGGRWGYWGDRADIRIDAYGRDTTYSSTDVMVARIRDLSQIGRAIDTALVTGAQSISNVEFTSTATAKARLTALEQATKGARENAEAIAKASGQHLGALVELTTAKPADRDYAAFRLDEVVSTGSGGGNDHTTIIAPRLSVGATVYGRWRIAMQ